MNRTPTITTIAMCAALLGVGCVDPNGRLDEFAEGFADASTGEQPGKAPPDAEVEPLVQLPDATGAFFLTLVPAGLGINIYYLADSELVAEDAIGTLSLSLRALSVDGLAPSGEPISLGNIAVDDHGAFAADFGTITIPGAANPLSGTDITTSIVLSGTILSTDLLCGDATGQVTVPLALDLAGTTWAGLRVAAGTSGADLPDPVPDCESARALLPDGN